ncbi:hypothetical protein PENTCL1PPCAC_9402, partial [Pristionchus entomophagus]
LRIIDCVLPYSMSVPLSQLVFESDLLVEDGAFELIDTSGTENQPMTSTFQPALEAEPLLLHAPDDFLQPTTSQFCDWLQNGGPLMSDDAVNDHRYLPSNTAFDRLVNATHDYYDKVPQMDLDPGQAEHSYAYFLPPHAASAPTPMADQTTSATSDRVDDVNPETGASKPNRTGLPSSSTTVTTVSPPAAEFPTAYAAEEMECAWVTEEGGVKCEWRGARCTVEAHVSAAHVGRGVAQPVCRWNQCNKSFARRYLLLRHVRCLHCEDKPFLCEECGARFALKERRKLHQRVSHGQHLQLKLPRSMQQAQQQPTGDPVVQQLQYPELPQLQRMQHPRPRPPGYPCDRCDQTFPTTAHRRHHVERIHDKILFPCDHCWLSFADRSSLRRHQKRIQKGKTNG